MALVSTLKLYGWRALVLFKGAALGLTGRRRRGLIVMRMSKTLTLEESISRYVDETKGDRSASDRVNELLRLAIFHEQYDRLEAEAAEFFAGASTEHAATKAFQKASLRTLRRRAFGSLRSRS